MHADLTQKKVDNEIETTTDNAETETKKLQQRIADMDLFESCFQEDERKALREYMNDGTTLLHKAVEKAFNESIKTLLLYIDDIDMTLIKNSHGHTSLHIAAIVGNKDVAKLLVKKNTKMVCIKDNEGHTPLDRANENRHRDVATLLKAAEKETNKFRKQISDENWRAVYLKLKRRDALEEIIDSHGNTLLHKVVEISRNGLVKRILYHLYIDLTKLKNANGSTVLHIAAIVGNTYGAELLVKEYKQLLDIGDNEGKTPLDKAKENKHTNTIAYLQEAAKKTTDPNKEFRQLIRDGDWHAVYCKLKEINTLTEEINSDGNTLLHIAVEMCHFSFLEGIVKLKGAQYLTETKNSDGSTALHIAAILGNTYAAKMLVKKNKNLLHIKDNDGKSPLDKAYENMHLDTSAYLLEAVEEHEKDQEEPTANPQRKKDAANNDRTRSTPLSVNLGANLLVNAISSKQYDFASKLISRNPEYAVFNDNLLMAMARTFPSGLDYGERFVYPSLENTSEMLVKRTKRLFNISVDISNEVKENWPILCCEDGLQDSGKVALSLILYAPLVMGYWICHLIPILLLMVYFPFFMLYMLWWKAATIAVPPVKDIEQKKKEYEDAKNVLELVLETIKKCPGSSRDLYTGPILEAACQDANEVVYQILGRWPAAIRCKDKNGYDIIQLATIHRSERIYNLIYIIGGLKSIYRTIEDSSKNNLLHLAGRLAPSNKLKRRTGAALQLQRELQWRQEVEMLVFPTFVTKENIFMETPEAVFTKEHENLVKEGEKWIKTVAESCSITAALITTIVFAAAITVPGGSNQETGIPVFTKQAAFTLFAIADAISLFSSATALLVFLSILTARFAEQDFLIRLPRRLIIGLCTLLISTTAMMVAFSATLFLVFSQQKLWVLAPICAFALLPIAFFFVLQLPLILDLIQSTYIFKFGKLDDESTKLVQNNIHLMFSN